MILIVNLLNKLIYSIYLKMDIKVYNNNNLNIKNKLIKLKKK